MIWRQNASSCHRSYFERSTSGWKWTASAAAEKFGDAFLIRRDFRPPSTHRILIAVAMASAAIVGAGAAGVGAFLWLCMNKAQLTVPHGVDKALLAEAVQLFREQYGSAPTRGASAPGRVNIIGEHTDYSEGFVFPMAIDRQTIVVGRINGTARYAGFQAYHGVLV